MSLKPFAPALTIANPTACTNPVEPGGPWMAYATGLTGSACPDKGKVTAVGITFNTPTGYKNTTGGNFVLLQLISADTITGEAATSYGAGLDTEYPYGGPPSNDSPDIALASTATSVSRNFSANMFLLWQSTTANSIPVPLGYQSWGVNGTATCSKTCGTASSWKATTTGTPGPTGSFTASSASQTKVGNNILVHGYPTWTSISR